MAGTFELYDSRTNARTMDVTLSVAVTEGEIKTVGNTIGFVFATMSTATSNTLETDTYTLVYQADKVQANKDNEAISQGALVYWDGAEVSASSTGGSLIGHCIEAATATDTTVMIDFDGRLANLV